MCSCEQLHNQMVPSYFFSYPGSAGGTSADAHHSNKRTPAVLPNGPAYPLDAHNQPQHKRPCTSQHNCATPEPQSHTVPDGHTTDPSNDAETNGDSSLRRVT